MHRLNLLSNPSFRGNLDHWEPINGAVIQLAEGYAFYGDSSLRIIKSTDPGTGVQHVDLIEVDSNLPYAVSAYIRAPITIPTTEDASVIMQVTWYDEEMNTLSYDSTASATIAPADGWVRISAVFSSPLDSKRARLAITHAIEGTEGAEFYVDAVLMEQSAFVGGYLDNVDEATESSLLHKALTPASPPTVGGMELNADIIINDLVLNTIDEMGNIWVCTDIVNWWGHSMPEVPDIPRGTEDGSYNVQGRYQARTLTLTGVILPSNPKNVPAARDRLIRATNLVRAGGWLRTNEDPTRAAYVRLSGQPKIQTMNARGRTEFSIGLKAADPIRYHWNDADINGFTKLTVPGNFIADVENIGTSTVTATFRIQGPAGIGSTIHNSANNQTIRTNYTLRGGTAIAAVTSRELTDNKVTLTVADPHPVVVGDRITVFGVGTAFDTAEDPWVVTAVSNINPYTISYEREWVDVPAAAATGSVGLASRDALEIDTYERSVLFNDSSIGGRSKVDTMIDWIKLEPGVNSISFTDEIEVVPVVHKSMSSGKVTLQTGRAHFFEPGEEIEVNLPTAASLASKIMTSQVATITTEEPHGFSVGDRIDVVSTETTPITQKQRDANSAILTTTPDSGYNVGDTVLIELPVSRSVIEKSASGGTVTMTTSAPHGYSAGDTVTITMPTAANIVNKAVATNIATLTTSAPHNFSVTDQITVTLPTVTTVTNKYRQGDIVRFTTATAHGFSTGDRVNIAFPTTVKITGSSYNPLTQEVTLTTDAAHNFSQFDRITVATDIPASMTVTNKAYTTTTCTLTLSVTGNAKPIVGEEVTVSIGDANYDGTYIVTVSGSSDNLITYEKTHSGTQTTTAASGTVTNKTVQTGYNGSKVIDSMTATTITYKYYGFIGTGTSTLTRASTHFTTNATITDTTNQLMNGTRTITSTPPSQFSIDLKESV